MNNIYFGPILNQTMQYCVDEVLPNPLGDISNTRAGSQNCPKKPTTRRTTVVFEKTVFPEFVENRK